MATLNSKRLSGQRARQDLNAAAGYASSLSQAAGAPGQPAAGLAQGIRNRGKALEKSQTITAFNVKQQQANNQARNQAAAENRYSNLAKQGLDAAKDRRASKQADQALSLRERALEEQERAAGVGEKGDNKDRRLKQDATEATNATIAEKEKRRQENIDNKAAALVAAEEKKETGRNARASKEKGGLYLSETPAPIIGGLTKEKWDTSSIQDEAGQERFQQGLDYYEQRYPNADESDIAQWAAAGIGLVPPRPVKPFYGAEGEKTVVKEQQSAPGKNGAPAAPTVDNGFKPIGEAKPVTKTPGIKAKPGINGRPPTPPRPAPDPATIPARQEKDTEAIDWLSKGSGTPEERATVANIAGVSLDDIDTEIKVKAGQARRDAATGEPSTTAKKDNQQQAQRLSKAKRIIRVSKDPAAIEIAEKYIQSLQNQE